MATPAAPSQQEFWNGHAGAQWVQRMPVLDAMLAPMTAPAMDKLDLQRGMRVLDIGCGAGTTTMILGQRVGHEGAAVGVDISSPLVNLANRRIGQAASNARVYDLDASAADVPGAPFDAAFSRFGVMFFEQPEAALAHLRKQVKPGGKLAFVCWRGIEENPWNRIPLEAVRGMLKEVPPPPDPNAPGPMAFANPDHTRGLLEAADWRDIAMEKWDGPVPLGKDARETATFMGAMAVSRLVEAQGLDPNEAVTRIAEALAPLRTPTGLEAPAACWIVTAKA
jgi:SAM-dependent methyltransferase